MEIEEPGHVKARETARLPSRLMQHGVESLGTYTWNNGDIMHAIATLLCFGLGPLKINFVLMRRLSDGLVVMRIKGTKKWPRAAMRVGSRIPAGSGNPVCKESLLCQIRLSFAWQQVTSECEPSYNSTPPQWQDLTNANGLKCRQHLSI